MRPHRGSVGGPSSAARGAGGVGAAAGKRRHPQSGDRGGTWATAVLPSGDHGGVRAHLLEGEAALASSRAETKVGRSDLLESEAALASSRAETKVGRTDLLASAVALASLRAEFEAGQVASDAALASSREETKLTLADFVASAVALALAEAETRVGRADLLASEVANKALILANGHRRPLRWRPPCGFDP